MTIATAGAALTENAFFSSGATEDSVSPDWNREILPIVPASRTTGTTGASDPGNSLRKPSARGRKTLPLHVESFVMEVKMARPRDFRQPRAASARKRSAPAQDRFRLLRPAAVRPMQHQAGL